MKITGLDLYQFDIPIIEPKTFANRTYDSFDNTVVCIRTDTKHVGWAEICPIASTYQPEHALGVRAAIEEMAPGLMGLDPTQTAVVNCTMNNWLMGGLNAKSAIDIACWDLVGKAHNKPLYQMIGGALQDKAKGYCAVELNDTEQIATDIAAYRAKGYQHFQIKNKTNDITRAIERIRTASEYLRPGEVMAVDANKAWATHEAIRICRATDTIDYYMEQPCITYEECLSVRRQIRQPMDMWGADLSAAAQVHLAVSSPARTCLASYISTDFSKLRYDIEAPALENGYISPNAKSGLGVEPSMVVLGEPTMQFS